MSSRTLNTEKGHHRCYLEWHLPSTSIRMKSCAPAAANLQHPLQELRAESRKGRPVLRGKPGRTGLPMIAEYSQELIL